MKVEVPSGKDESIRFGRVGIIAVVGFGIGIVWPHLAGVKLVPSVPAPAGESSAADLSGAPLPERSNLGVASAEPAPAPPEDKPEPRRVTVSEPQFLTCRSKAGKRHESCDPIAFDALARSHLDNLAQCEGVDDVDGVLSLGFDLDFESERIKSIASGKSTSLEQKQVDGLLVCAKREFENVSLAGIAHQHATYSVFYRIEFQKRELVEPAKAAPSAEPVVEGEVTSASGRATVAWDVALIRSAPSRDGQVVARILSGTRVMVSGRRGDWYRIKYDAKGNQGWVFRTAIGM